MSAPDAVRRLVHGVGVEIVCDNGELADLVARRLAAFPIGDRPADIRVEIGAALDVSGERPSDVRVVHEAKRGAVFYSDALDTVWIDYVGGEARCSPGRGAAAIAYNREREGWQWATTRPLLTVTLMELLKRRCLFPVHASAACRDGSAVLFAAKSGSGKSTAALALLLAGWRLLGDDLLFLREDGSELQALAFPDEIDASPRTIARLPELGPLERWPTLSGYPKRQLPPQQLRPGAVALEATTRLVLVPHVVDAPGHALEPLSPDELLLELLPNVLLTEPSLAQRQLDLLARLSSTVPAFRLAFGGDLSRLGETVEDALARAGV
jgi:hypothetical protein